MSRLLFFKPGSLSRARNELRFFFKAHSYTRRVTVFSRNTKQYYLSQNKKTTLDVEDNYKLDKIYIYIRENERPVYHAACKDEYRPKNKSN